MYFIYQNWRTLPICVLTDTCCRHLNILNWWTRTPGRRRERPDTDCNQTCYLLSFHLLHSLFFHYIQQEQCIFKRVGILFLFFRHRVINNNLHTHNYWSYISYKTHVETTDHCSSWENAMNNISRADPPWCPACAGCCCKESTPCSSHTCTCSPRPCWFPVTRSRLITKYILEEL